MKILLPVDGSECCHKTLAWATDFLNKRDEIYFLYIIRVSSVLPEYPDITYRFEMEEAERVLQSAKFVFEDAGFKVAETTYSIGDPGRGICDYADENHIDQIVIGSHGFGILKRLLLGSVSRAVLEHAKQPVLLFNAGKNSAFQADEENVCALDTH